MNLCILSGRIHANATLREAKEKGKASALSFIVETVNRSNGEEKKDLVSCVLFKPERDLEELLTERGEGLYVELEGRVNSSSLKTAGEKRYNSDVIVRSWTFTIVEPHEPVGA